MLQTGQIYSTNEWTKPEKDGRPEQQRIRIDYTLPNNQEGYVDVSIKQLNNYLKRSGYPANTQLNGKKITVNFWNRGEETKPITDDKGKVVSEAITITSDYTIARSATISEWTFQDVFAQNMGAAMAAMMSGAGAPVASPQPQVEEVEAEAEV